jgi:chromosomal replication initiator protein
MDEREILAKVARFFKLTVDVLKGTKRTQHISLARHIAMYLIREKTDLSFPDIGELMERDHSTVIHAHKKITSRINRDTAFGFTVNAIGVYSLKNIPWEMRAEDQRGCLA